LYRPPKVRQGKYRQFLVERNCDEEEASIFVC
jgi:hypothetical protein